MWPLSWLQDFPGTIARSAGDLADMLNVTTGTDPLDPITVAADADAHRPADWRTSLDPNALQGKRIGYYDSAFVDPFGTTGTANAQKAALQYFQAAGATLVKVDGGPPNLNIAGGAKDFTGDLGPLFWRIFKDQAVDWFREVSVYERARPKLTATCEEIAGPDDPPVPTAGVALR